MTVTLTLNASGVRKGPAQRTGSQREYVKRKTGGESQTTLTVVWPKKAVRRMRQFVVSGSTSYRKSARKHKYFSDVNKKIKMAAPGGCESAQMVTNGVSYYCYSSSIFSLYQSSHFDSVRRLNVRCLGHFSLLTYISLFSTF